VAADDAEAAGINHDASTAMGTAGSLHDICSTRHSIPACEALLTRRVQKVATGGGRCGWGAAWHLGCNGMENWVQR